MIPRDQPDDIVVVATASNYAAGLDAPALWDTVLHQRRTFRDIPPERLPLEDYAPSGNGDSDTISITSAALIQGWKFDPQRYHTPKDQVPVTDTSHWLALDTGVRLVQSLTASGLQIDKPRTGVVLGNSLTGETSRALALRHRWPYVRRAVLSAQAQTGCSPDPEFLAALERTFKEPLASPTTDSLAGGLSNTISGRIMNHLDLRGPNFTVDGACASSLLSVVQVKSMLDRRVIDLGIAGGVDMSIDPFELVGFSRLGAMAAGEMRVYDEHPTGFIPGEGCGMVALMRRADADRAGLPVLAVIAGTGMSSDGQGGLTRPSEDGHLAAAEVAYTEARLSPDNVKLFEGHGTGTAIGDATEVAVFARLRDPRVHPAAIGSVKANIGHTKAAAGVAGLIKVLTAITEGVLPPNTGTDRPSPALRECKTLRVLREPEQWDGPVRVAGVSALGFGGINTHVVVREGTVPAPRRRPVTTSLANHALLVLTAGTTDEVLNDLGSLQARIRWYSDHECALAAAHKTWAADLRLPIRVAIPASDRGSLRRGLSDAINVLTQARRPGSNHLLHVGAAAVGIGHHKIGLIFPGQGAPIPRRPPPIRATLEPSDLAAVDSVIAWTSQDPRTSTDVAQPGIMASSLLGNSWLAQLGCTPHGAVGHSLGEIAAVCWAGGLALDEAVRLATTRGRLMTELGKSGTGMASVTADQRTIKDLIEALRAPSPPVIAAYNGPGQVTVAGRDDVLADLVELAHRRGVPTKRLAVSHAFHSPAMAPVVRPYETALQQTRFLSTTRRYVSTITGTFKEVGSTADQLRTLLSRQLVEPVQFENALNNLAEEVDLLVEVGPGRAMTSLVQGITTVPAVAMDLSGSGYGLVCAVAALVAAGQVTDLRPWNDLTPHSPVTFDHEPALLTNPCGLDRQDQDLRASSDPCPAPRRTENPAPIRPEPAKRNHTDSTVLLDPGITTAARDGTATGDVEDTLRLLRGDVMDTTGLELPMQSQDLRFSSDLHLNSLQVNQLVARVATAMSRDLPAEPLSLADATLRQAAELLHALPAGSTDAEQWNPGDWVHTFVDRWISVEDAPVDGDNQTREQVVVHLRQPVTSGDVLRLRDATSGATDVLVVHEGVGLGAARSLFWERRDPQQSWTLAHVEPDVQVAPRHVPTASTDNFQDLKFQGGSWARRISERHRGAPRPVPARSGQITLVTGGLTGITAECAAELALHDGSRLLFVGRTPASSSRVREPLQALRDQGLRADYRRLDVTDPVLVFQVLAEVAPRITAIIHGAALNQPQNAPSVDLQALEAADAVKAMALRYLLQLVPPRNLTLLVTFGSIIERCGLEGQLSYAHANDVLRVLVEDVSGDVPGYTLHLQWSVWSGVGMGVGLGVLDGLSRRGVAPIPPDRGRAQFWEALTTAGPVTRLISGRYPSVPTRSLRTRATVPLGRYLETTSVEVPGTEVVGTCEISISTDRALAHHQIAGLPVLPAVCALEAAAQAAAAVDPHRSWRSFTNIDLLRAVTLEPGERLSMQVAALDLTGDGTLHVRLRTRNLDVATAQVHPLPPVPEPWRAGSHPGSANPLYDELLFHSGPFRRVNSLQTVSASTLTAQLATDPATWFSPFFGQDLHLGDPGVLDASIHALQACFPQRQLLPVGAEAFTVHNPTPAGLCTLIARERMGASTEEDITFDVSLVDCTGAPVLDWSGLSLRGSHNLKGVATLQLVAPAVARAVRGHGLDPSLDMIVTSTRLGVREALQTIGGTGAREPCGRLKHPAGGGASTSSSGQHRLTGYSHGHHIGVDWEVGNTVPTVGGDLGRRAAMMRSAVGLPPDTAARLAWVSAEAVKKAGGTLSALEPSSSVGVDDPAGVGVVLTGPTHTVYAGELTVTGVEGEDVAVAVAVRR